MDEYQWHDAHARYPATPLALLAEPGHGHFDGQQIFTVARGGKWSVRLLPLSASGQSNMERQLGPRPPQPDIDNWRQEAAAVRYGFVNVPDVNLCNMEGLPASPFRTDVG